MNKELREELRQIQAELRKPFAPEEHSIRELPGTTNLWIYLDWQAVRDRLDEVVPDHEFEFTFPQYDHTANLVSCVVTLNILGIKKQALASVPIAQLSSKGKDMSRGNAVDRLHAEAIKNGAEAHGVGRYLDNQEFCFKLLWEGKARLDEETTGKLNQMKNQFREALKKNLGYAETPKVKPVTHREPGILEGVAGVSLDKISEQQDKLLWGKGRSELGLSAEAIKSAIASFGFNSSKEITKVKFNQVLEYLEKLASQKAPTQQQPQQPQAPQILYPQHETFVKRLQSLTTHTDQWIIAQCNSYGVDRPGNLDQENLRKLCKAIAVDYAVYTGWAVNREGANMAFDSRVNFFEQTGKRFGEGVIDFIEGAAKTVASR